MRGELENGGHPALDVECLVMVKDRSAGFRAGRFVLTRRGGTLSCPRLRLTRSGARRGLPDLVVAAVKRELKMDTAYVGAVDFNDDPETPALAVLLTVEAVPTAPQLQALSLSAIRSRDLEIRPELFETAERWCEAETAATRLRRDIDQAAQRSTNLLLRSLAKDQGHQGWQQYFRKDSVGVLSTANGILACVYAGGPEAWRLVDAPLASLRDFQAPEGGWRIRRSLVGAQSDKLITESTCHCLLAFLEAGHRSPEDDTVKRGLDWLVAQQHEDGGWSSTKQGHHSQVYPTALAVRILGLYRQKDAARKGIDWLLRTQCDDGGWGATGNAGNGPVSSSPAYAAAAISALIAADVDVGDSAIKRACDYLRRTFDPHRPEPWEATSFNTLVDREQHANLEFRHFATPYALAALCDAGYDLSDPTVLTATRRLLALQNDAGAFHCGLTAPDDRPVWAVCGALYALRRVRDSSGRDLAPLTLRAYRDLDRSVLAKTAGHGFLAAVTGPGGSAHDTAIWTWRSVLPAVVIAAVIAAVTATAVVLVVQSGAFGGVKASTASKAGVGVLSFLSAIITAAVAPILTEVLKNRKRRRNDGS